MNINATLIGQIIWFIVFVWFTMRYVWPPLQKAMHARQKQIADGLAAGERGKQELEAASRKSTDAMQEARKQAAEVIAQGEKRAAQIVEEARVTARSEGERLVAAAKEEIEQEVSRAKETLRAQVSVLAVKGAEKILRREVDARAHAELLQSMQAEL